MEYLWVEIEFDGTLGWTAATLKLVQIVWAELPRQIDQREGLLSQLISAPNKKNDAGKSYWWLACLGDCVTLARLRDPLTPTPCWNDEPYLVTSLRASGSMEIALWWSSLHGTSFSTRKP